MRGRSATLAVALGTAMVIAGCAPGSIRNRSDAITAVERIAGLSAPITILDVREGAAGQIFNGPPPSLTDDMIAREAARRVRPAWAVDIRGFVQQPCADTALLPCGLVTMELVIDRDTGAVIYSEIEG